MNRETERRNSPRLNLTLNVEFLREGEETQACHLGTTANVSAGGVYFSTPEYQHVDPGTRIGLRLSGLSGYGTGPLFRSLRARGRVVRVDRPEAAEAVYDKAGVAVEFVEKPCFEVYRWSE